MKKTNKLNNYRQEIRIISGLLKNSKIKIEKNNDLRPTPERLRETLFNWLINEIDLNTASIIDMFSGSGVLGLEALSRGAKKVLFIEKNKTIFNQLQKQISHFSEQLLEQFIIKNIDIFYYENTEQFDIIFCDPPFSFYGEKNKPNIDFIKLLFLKINQLSHENSIIFLESPFDITHYRDQVCFTWNIIKSVQYGQVYALLIIKNKEKI